MVWPHQPSITLWKLVDIMNPFKPLLSQKTPFQWTDDLEAAFQQSKDKIIAAIKHDVQIFYPSRKTCFSPDWSNCIGYWLSQQYCDCDSDVPECFEGGGRLHLQDPGSFGQLNSDTHL